MDMARVGLPREGVSRGGGPMPSSEYFCAGVLGLGVEGVLGLSGVVGLLCGKASDLVCL